MGLFGIGKKKKSKDLGLGNLPELPQLPELPPLPQQQSKTKLPSLSKKPMQLKPLPDMDIPEIKVKPRKIIRKQPEMHIEQPIRIEQEKPKRQIRNIIKRPLSVLSKAKRYEDKAVRIEEEELEEIHEHIMKKPVYVEGNLFKEMLTDISIMNSELKECNDSLEKVKSIENRKGTKFSNFKSSILSTQRKLILIDKLLFK